MPNLSPPIDYATPGSAPPRASGVATAALACGIVGLLVPLVGVAAIFLGVRGVRRARLPGFGGRERSIVGIWMGAIGTVVWVGLIVFLVIGIRSALRSAGIIYSTANLRQIGTAIAIYADENVGHYPPDFTTLLGATDITVEQFVSPIGRSRRATTRWASDPAARAARNLDYVYVGEGLTNAASAAEPVAIEPPAIRGGDGGNVLFGDGQRRMADAGTACAVDRPARGHATPRCGGGEGAGQAVRRFCSLSPVVGGEGWGEGVET